MPLPVGSYLYERDTVAAGKTRGQRIGSSGPAADHGFDVLHAERAEQTLLQPCVIAECARTCHRKLHLPPHGAVPCRNRRFFSIRYGLHHRKALDFPAQQGNNGAGHAPHVTTARSSMSQHLQLDPELAAKAESLFLELGLDLSTAVHLFLRQSLRENGLPFTLRLGVPVPAAPASQPAPENPVQENPAPESPEPPRADGNADVEALEGESFGSTEEIPAFMTAQADDTPAAPAPLPAPELAPAGSVLDREDAQLSDPRQVFHDMKLIGAPLRRIRSLNQLYAIGEANPHVQGWREVYVSGDEPFALDFGSVRVELGWQGGGSIRMMDGRLPDEVLESDAVFPRELSPVFSSVIGQRLVDVSSTRVRRGSEESEQLRLRFANGSTLTFSPGENWAGLWLSDAHGSVMYAPDAVWRRVLGERAWQSLR